MDEMVKMMKKRSRSYYKEWFKATFGLVDRKGGNQSTADSRGINCTRL